MLEGFLTSSVISCVGIWELLRGSGTISGCYVECLVCHSDCISWMVNYGGSPLIR